MSTLTEGEFTRKTCAPCPGGIPPLSPQEAQALATNASGWSLSAGGQRIRRSWVVRDSVAGIAAQQGRRAG